MLLGPIFRAELLRTARRRRYYAMRTLYGMLLLFIIWAAYEGSTLRGAPITIDEAAEFALNTFYVFAIIQIITILLLIPALFGGAIADEKQRKTLHYLMASQLSSFEIVVDKVLGRVPHVAVFLAIGLPVICLLGLVGGVPPEYVAAAYLGTISTATMAVALTVLISTLSRKVRQSVLIAYILLAAWQFVPVVLFWMNRGRTNFFPTTYAWIEPINVWVAATTPLYVYVKLNMVMGSRAAVTGFAAEQLAWMVGLQLGAAALFLWLAVWQLRPTFRRHEATQPRRKWFEGSPSKSRKIRPRRWYDRPECGADAMAWKERHFARTDIFTKLVVLPATVLVSVFLVLVVGVDESITNAFSDLWIRGFRGWGRGGETLAYHLRVVSGWFVAVWLLAVAGASASSIAVEREEDTWVSLTTTPLTGWEILRGKVLGALWAQRGFAAVPLGFWVIGLITGAVHALGFLVALVAFAVVSWMVAAVGIHASLKATTTSKALTSTIATLAVLYGYPLFVLAQLTVGVNGMFQTWELFVGLPATLAVAPLMSYEWASQAWRQLTEVGFRSPSGFLLSLSLFGLGSYAAIAAALTYRSVTQFDCWLDRPILADDVRDSRKPASFADEVEPGLVLQS